MCGWFHCRLNFQLFVLLFYTFTRKVCNFTDGCFDPLIFKMLMDSVLFLTNIVLIWCMYSHKPSLVLQDSSCLIWCWRRHQFQISDCGDAVVWCSHSHLLRSTSESLTDVRKQRLPTNQLHQPSLYAYLSVLYSLRYCKARNFLVLKFCGLTKK